MSEEYNLFYFFKQFPDEESCWKYLEKRRWGNTPICTERLSSVQTAKSNFR